MRRNLSSFLGAFLCCIGLVHVYGRVTVRTEKEKSCRFPFVYEGNILFDCAYGAGGKAWCALTANYAKDGQWGYCDATRSPRIKSYGGNAGSAECVFPFVVSGVEYKYCTRKDASVPWCATTKDYSTDKKWGYCNGYLPENQFKPFSSNHVGLLSFGDTNALSATTRQAIVDEHNSLRNGVTPTATNMMKMVYSEALEQLARKWVNKCEDGHPDINNLPGMASAGQNAFASGGPTTWKNAINAWYNEVKDFTYGQSSTSVTGHYTQVVWARSTTVGCAMKICSDGLPRPRHRYVCNYGPSGNLHPAFKPYETGSTGSSCKVRDSKYSNLCLCEIHGCLNGASIDPKTCTCPCNTGQVGPRCAIDCDTAVDPWYCPTTYKGGCTIYSNVPFACPQMCGICPS
ncbi:cysteine-rich venom protein-like [Lineus longissimus]|uniref:cysteine-rich venom protein-like n=1 Tax=Lineus longissimus TaxID=88925 RepID=UPI002B4E191B